MANHNSTHFTVEDIEKINSLARYYGHKFVSFAPIRDKQDASYTQQIARMALARLQQSGLARLAGPNMFVGCINMVVRQAEGGGVEFCVLDANGGSSRGLSSLAFPQGRMLLRGYWEALSHAPRPDPLIVIGHLRDDKLMGERIILAETLAEKLEERGVETHIRQVDDLSFQLPNRGAWIVLGDYRTLVPQISCYRNVALLRGRPVDIIMGDGLMRRHANLLRLDRAGKLKTLVVNSIYPITDDRGVAAQAVREAQDVLAQFRIAPLQTWREPDQKRLHARLEQVVAQLGSAVIKPHGGSSGVGIQLVDDPARIGRAIEDSLHDFYDRFGTDRSPFPYTVSERVEVRPVTWHDGSQRIFNVRVYVARQGDELAPVGVLVRVAADPYVPPHYSKRSFVVNLVSYGKMDASRGLGLSPETSELLGLTTADWEDMFCGTAALFAYFSQNLDSLRAASYKT